MPRLKSIRNHEYYAKLDNSPQALRGCRKAFKRGFLIGAGAIGVLTLLALAARALHVQNDAVLIPLLCPLLPGIFAMMFTTILCGGSVGIGFLGGNSPPPSNLAWIPWVVYVGVNALVYGGIVGIIVRFRYRRKMRIEHMMMLLPKCSQCGFEWNIPLVSECPKCKDKSGFEQWMNTTLPNSCCDSCGYDLRASKGENCPECGKPISRKMNMLPPYISCYHCGYDVRNCEGVYCPDCGKEILRKET